MHLSDNEHPSGPVARIYHDTPSIWCNMCMHDYDDISEFIQNKTILKGACSIYKTCVSTK